MKRLLSTIALAVLLTNLIYSQDREKPLADSLREEGNLKWH